jgi:hypothetical protein
LEDNMPPEVITGPRDNSIFPERSQNQFSGFFAPGMIGESSQSAAKNVKVWHCRYRNFTLILEAKKSYIMDGEKIEPENMKAEFFDNSCVLNMENPVHVKIDAALEKHHLHGLNKYFWRPREREEALTAVQVQDTLLRLKDPDFIEALQKKVGSDEFAGLNIILDALTSTTTKEKEVVDPPSPSPTENSNKKK